jgi:hypothetical protein
MKILLSSIGVTEGNNSNNNNTCNNNCSNYINNNFLTSGGEGGVKGLWAKNMD